MAERLDIHPDFQNLRAFALPSNRYLLAFMNGILQRVVAFKSRDFKHLIARTKISASDGYRIPILIIKPENLKTPCGALLYFHGGSFIMKQAPQHICNVVRYASEANCCVIFVDYRMPPKYPFPIPFNDCYEALRWAFQNADKLDIDKMRIAVSGDSAGGALAATVAQKARDENIKLCGQMLLYPVADAGCKTHSGTLYPDIAPMKKYSTRRSWETYLGHALEAGLPAYASPIHGDLNGVAPAYIETTEYDPLHDESLAYAHALQRAGVDVVLNETKQTVHGYDLVAPDSALAQDAIKTRVQFLRKIFGA